MKRKHFRVQLIIRRLREAAVHLPQGRNARLVNGISGLPS